MRNRNRIYESGPACFIQPLCETQAVHSDGPAKAVTHAYDLDGSRASLT